MTHPAQAIPSEDELNPAQPWPWLLGGTTILLWLYLVLPELIDLTKLVSTLTPFNLMLLVGATVVLSLQGIRRRAEWHFTLQPTFQGLPLILLLGSAIATQLAHTLLDLEHLAVVGLVVSAYALLGLFCHPTPWKRSLPFMGAFAILMLLFALEFTDLGHLARTSIAEIVAFLLRPAHVDAISSEDILVLSTGVAFVDIPCSGFKNIEIGGLFFIAASLLERKRMGWRWSLVGGVTVALLLLANVARILAIVALTFIFKQQTLAEVLHVPLGVCGFVTVCGITLLLLRWVPRQRHRLENSTAPSLRPLPPAAHRRHAVLTLSLLLGLALLPHPAAVSPITFTPLGLPISTEVIDLTPQEQNFFARYPGVVAQKQAFESPTLSGSLLLVASPTWQAHHAPELCLTGSGFHIDQMQKRDLTRTVTGRWLSLNQGQRRAAYWFQSPQRTTDRYLDRVWSEIIRRDPKWTMVSIVFDQPVSAEDSTVQTLLTDVHDAISTAMT